MILSVLSDKLFNRQRCQAAMHSTELQHYIGLRAKAQAQILWELKWLRINGTNVIMNYIEAVFVRKYACLAPLLHTELARTLG